MAEKTLGKVIEFLVGLIILPLIVGFIGGIIIGFPLKALGFASTEGQAVGYAEIGTYVLDVIAILLLFITKRFKWVGIGYIVSFVLSLVGFSLSKLLGF